MPPAMASAIEKLDIELVGTVSNDSVMTEFEFSGRPLVDLPVDSKVVLAVNMIAD